MPRFTRALGLLAAAVPLVAPPFMARCFAEASPGLVSPVASASVVPAASPRGEAARHHLRLQGTWALGRGTDFFADGHFQDMAHGNAGVDFDYLFSPGRLFTVGAGARYSYGSGISPYGGPHTESEQFAFVPFLLGWRGGTSRVAADVTLGLGPALGALTWGTLPGRAHVFGWGAGGEIAPTFTFKATEKVGVTFGFAARVLALSLDRTGVESQLAGAPGVHGEVTARAGLALDL